jgi:L-malate glycosyltransferase
MKVLVVSNMYPSAAHPSYGVFVERITRQMREHGLETRLAVKAADGNKLVSYLRFYWRAFFMALRGDEDLLYLHFVTHSWLPVALARLLRRRPVAVHVHGADIVPEDPRKHLKNAISRRIARHALRAADLVVAPSAYFRDEVGTRFPEAQGKIEVSPSGGVDLQRFAFKPLPDDSRRRVLFLGRLIEGKGVLQVLPALQACHERSPGMAVEMVFAGDGPLRGQLESAAARLPDSIPVSFLGNVPPDRVPEAMASCHFLVFPSFRKGESLGLVALEAMACGRPIVAARNGAMPELMGEGRNGRLFEANDQASFARAILDLLEHDDAVLREMCANARGTAERYSAQSVGARLAELLRQRFGRLAS